MSLMPFEGLRPELVWKRFAELTKIPRCSKNEYATRKYVLEWAKEKRLEASEDTAGNVVVRVPASPGYEKVPIVILQGHMDMVGEKTSDSSHNFSTDPIPVVREGEYITADGTTLGADNGIGLAVAMALAEDSEAIHPKLELLMTVDEETGLTGARKLDSGFIHGKILLNLDSEEQDSLYVGCAGGAETVIELPVERISIGEDTSAYQVKVYGLKGGHSGLDINTGCANALKVLAWFFDTLRKNTVFSLVDLVGGDKHNAIPREARATFVLNSSSISVADRVCQSFSHDLRAAYGKTDAGIAIKLSRIQSSLLPLTKKSTDTVIDLLLALPHGVLGMSQEVEDLVETSTNLAVCRVESKRAYFQESSRSSLQQAIQILQASLFAMGRLAGGTCIDKGSYPGWQPNMDSALLKRARAVYEKTQGKPAQVKAVHAGLECGIIGEKLGGDMEMISFGPQIEFPHSPREQVHILSVEKFYAFLSALVEDLAYSKEL